MSDEMIKYALSDEDTVQVFSSEEFGSVRTVTKDGEPWFVARDVAGALGYKNPSSAVITGVANKNHRKIKILTNGGLQTLGFISEQGVWELISRAGNVPITRKDELVHHFNVFGFLEDTPYYFRERKEISFVSKLSDVLSGMGINSETQYHILRYRIDLYIPKYELCVEYDEHNHSSYTYEQHEGRENKIRKLGYKFVRVTDSNTDEYNIGIVIKAILNEMESEC